MLRNSIFAEPEVDPAHVAEACSVAREAQAVAEKLAAILDGQGLSSAEQLSVFELWGEHLSEALYRKDGLMQRVWIKAFEANPPGLIMLDDVQRRKRMRAMEDAIEAYAAENS